MGGEVWRQLKYCINVLKCQTFSLVVTISKIKKGTKISTVECFSADSNWTQEVFRQNQTSNFPSNFWLQGCEVSLKNYNSNTTWPWKIYPATLGPSGVWGLFRISAVCWAMKIYCPTMDHFKLLETISRNLEQTTPDPDTLSCCSVFHPGLWLCINQIWRTANEHLS